jgi:SPP1 gp7 family putative phage head morphogenesis protein
MRAVEPPTRLAVDYERRLLRLRIAAWQHINATVLPAYASAISARGDAAGDGSVRLPSALSRAILALGPKLRTVMSDSAAREIASEQARRVDGRHRGEFYRRLNSAIGVEVVASEGFRGGLLNEWIAGNASLIKSVRQVDLRPDIERAFAGGIRHEVLRDQWKRRGLPLEFGTLEGRAKVIARDQINKLNGQLNEARQRNIGIDRWIWRTSRDERVRDEHAALDGQTFTWNDPPSEGIPGEPVQCRCVAEAVIDIDAILGNENVELRSAA